VERHTSNPRSPPWWALVFHCNLVNLPPVYSLIPAKHVPRFSLRQI
jgi:hypothetical protein